MSNPVGWFEIYVDEMQRAQAFYEKVLATKLEPLIDPTEDGFTMMGFAADHSAHGCSGALVSTGEMVAGNNSTVVYFACEDCAVESSRVEDAGGTLVREKISLGEYGFCAMVKDSEGNMIGLHSMQ